MIHKTAIIEKGALLGKEVAVGPFSLIGPKAVIGDGSVIESHAVIEGRVTLGKNCRIGAGAVIGGRPQDLKYAGEDTEVVMGDRCTVREYVTVNRGTAANMRTLIGSGVFLMAYVHVAHDCVIGNDVILANCVTLAGHVNVEDQAIVGGLTPVHQFTRIGRLSIVGGGSRISKDVPPFCKVAGSPPKISGLNTIGLMRRNYSEEVRAQLKQAYKILFRSGLNISQAVSKISSDPSLESESVHFMTGFISGSLRGICKN